MLNFFKVRNRLQLINIFTIKTKHRSLKCQNESEEKHKESKFQYQGRQYKFCERTMIKRVYYMKEFIKEIHDLNFEVLRVWSAQKIPQYSIHGFHGILSLILRNM